MNFINRVIMSFKVHQLFSYLLLFIITIGLFTYLQLDPTFADPDSFYHAKITEILARGGVITEFPWLSATTLRYNFVDHHFLYHLVLIPFIKLFYPLVGLKIATILFATLTILVIYWFLRRLNVNGAFWYALFLLTVNPFIFRLNLAKAQALAIALFFVIIYLISSRRYLSLSLVSFFYVWLYGGWPIILILAVVYSLMNWFWVSRQRQRLFFKLKKLKIYWQSLLIIISTVVGLAAGLFFSPYFPKNLEFYWQQSFKIAVLNFQYIIDVGGEWYPYKIWDLILAATPFFTLFIFALFVFFYSLKKQAMHSWFFLVLSLLFLALTIKSRRYVEYFIPVSVCFSALSLNIYWDLYKEKLNKFLTWRYVRLLLLIIILTLCPVFFRDLEAIKISYSKGFSFNKFAQAADWLKEHSQQGDIVYHGDWDEFPLLFFHNDKNYYIVGLDPTFMYEYDKDMHRTYVEINAGQAKDNLAQIIKKVFGAKYIFVDFNQNDELDRNLANNFYFQKVYEDKEARIYQLAE